MDKGELDPDEKYVEDIREKSRRHRNSLVSLALFAILVLIVMLILWR